MSDLERQFRDQLRAREQHLDDNTLEGLRSARKKAVSRATGLRIPRFLIPLGGMTLASIAIFFLVLSPMHMQTLQPQDALPTESVDSQDLDFYYWLAETQNVTDS